MWGKGTMRQMEKKKNEGRGMKKDDEDNKRTKEGGCLAYWGPHQRISSSADRLKSTKLAL